MTVKKHIYHYSAKSWDSSSSFCAAEGMYHSELPIVGITELTALRKQMASVHGSKDPDAVWVIECLSYLGYHEVGTPE